MIIQYLISRNNVSPIHPKRIDARRGTVLGKPPYDSRRVACTSSEGLGELLSLLQCKGLRLSAGKARIVQKPVLAFIIHSGENSVVGPGFVDDRKFQQTIQRKRGGQPLHGRSRPPSGFGRIGFRMPRAEHR